MTLLWMLMEEKLTVILLLYNTVSQLCDTSQPLKDQIYPKPSFTSYHSYLIKHR